MKKLSNFIKFIQTKEMIVLALILSLISQLTHSVYAYVNLSHNETIWWTVFYIIVGLTFALGVSFSILILTLKGNKNKAYIYLGFEFLINLIYYRTYEVVLNEPVIAIVQILFAFIMPYTIASYSEMIGEINTNEKEELQIKLKQQSEQNQKLLSSVVNIENRIKDITDNQKEKFKEMILSDYEIEIGEKIGDRNFKIKLKSNNEE